MKTRKLCFVCISTLTCHGAARKDEFVTMVSQSFDLAIIDVHCLSLMHLVCVWKLVCVSACA
jgi:hypothetical protein